MIILSWLLSFTASDFNQTLSNQNMWFFGLVLVFKLHLSFHHGIICSMASVLDITFKELNNG